MIAAKWGGSFLTNKGQRGRPRYRAAAAARLARAWAGTLAQAGEPGLLVHGAGSFGHPQALAAGLGKRRLRGPALAAAVSSVQAHVDDLQQRVAATLRAAGLPVTVLPARACVRAVRGTFRIDPRPFQQAIRDGLHPLTGGDVVPDGRLGARILSGDEILHDLAKVLRPRIALFVGDTDGVLDERGRVHSVLMPGAARRVAKAVIHSTDATGGMGAKLEWAARMQDAGLRVALVNGTAPASLVAAALGKRGPGTTLPAAPVAPSTRGPSES